MEKKIGEVTHFFAGPSAAVLKLTTKLNLGQQIHIVGFTTDLTEKVTSMQINHMNVESGNPGDDVAILVKDRVREGDEVFLVEEGAMAEAPMAPSPAPRPAAPSPMAAKPAALKPAVKKPKPKPAKAKKPKAKKPKAKPKAKKPKAKPKAKKAKAKKPKAKAAKRRKTKR